MRKAHHWRPVRVAPQPSVTTDLRWLWTPPRVLLSVRATLFPMATGWSSRVGEDLEPRTWDQCLKMLLSLGGDDVLYRGHASFDWRLSSTLERALLENS